jgi:hypothetical protein
LILKKIAENEEEHDYRSEGLARVPNFNPPSEILYMTMIHPKQEGEIRSLCESIGCPVGVSEWKQNSKDKWMCLLEFSSLDESLYAMGRLQGWETASGKKVRLSFTRSRLKKKELPLQF